MTIEVETGLNELTRQQVLATRVTNALLLAANMGLDMSHPTEGQKVLRFLSLIEGKMGGDASV